MVLLPRLRSTLIRPFACTSRPAYRALHLAPPPWLLDDHIPRYHLISSIDASKKRSQACAHLSNCNLCPRLCGVNRYDETGVCLIGPEESRYDCAAFWGGYARFALSYTCTAMADCSHSPVCKATTALAASSSPDVICDVYALYI